jgi:hypothetical protein
MSHITIKLLRIQTGAGFLRELKRAVLSSRTSACYLYSSALRSLPAGGTILPALLSAFRCRTFDNLFTTCDVCHTFTQNVKLTASMYIAFLLLISVRTSKEDEKEFFVDLYSDVCHTFTQNDKRKESMYTLCKKIKGLQFC